MRHAALLGLLLFVVGCGPFRPLLDTRSNPFTDSEDAARAELVDRYNGLADRLQATAGYYDREVAKSHVKGRVMSVLVGVGATGSGATIASLAQPELPDDARPGLASLGVSMAVFSGLMAILPYAHQYALKERGYARQADLTWELHRAAQVECGAAVVLDPERSLAELGACIAGLEQALVEVRRFPEDSPCRAPLDRDMEGALRRVRR